MGWVNLTISMGGTGPTIPVPRMGSDNGARGFFDAPGPLEPMVQLSVQFMTVGGVPGSGMGCTANRHLVFIVKMLGEGALRVVGFVQGQPLSRSLQSRIKLSKPALKIFIEL